MGKPTRSTKKEPLGLKYLLLYVSNLEVFKTLFTWSGEPRFSGVSFFCFVSPKA